MFGLFSPKKSLESASRLRRLIDRTATWRIPDFETREAERSKRTLPVFLAPWKTSTASSLEMETGISVDLSDRGMRVLVMRQPRHSTYLASLINLEDGRPEYYSFVVDVVSCQKFGPGITALGLYVSDSIELAALPTELRMFLQTQAAEFMVHQPTSGRA